MSQPSLRRRDRRPRLDDEYYGFPDPHAPPPDISPRRAHVIQDEPPSSRSSKHDRYDRPRRHPSPDFYRNDPLAAHGGHSGRSSHQSRSVDPAMGSRRRGRSPAYGPEPSRYDSRPSRQPKDLPIRESHRSDRLPRDYQPRPRGASHDRDPYVTRATTLPTGYDSRPPRSRRPVSPEPRPRARGGPGRNYHDYDDYDDRPRRHRSQNPSSRGYGRSPSPPPRSRTHHGGTAAAAGAGAGAGAAAYGRPPRASGGGGRSARRNSMPATTRARVPWWQNPLIQAGGKAAVTAGAQAAMKSRNDQGAWLGAKGAKVATAALGAALVDSFIGQKHPGKESMARQGLEFATNAVGDYGPRAEQRFRKKR